MTTQDVRDYQEHVAGQLAQLTAAKAALEESEERFRSTFEQAAVDSPTFLQRGSFSWSTTASARSWGTPRRSSRN
jgi:hypothetical protein